MATSCDDNINGGGSSVILETSDDDGAMWQQVIAIHNLFDTAKPTLLLCRPYCHAVVVKIFPA